MLALHVVGGNFCDVGIDGLVVRLSNVFPMWALPDHMVQVSIRLPAMWATLIRHQLRFVKAVVGSDAASNDGLDSLLLDGILFDSFEVEVHARFFEDFRMLFNERGSGGGDEALRGKGINRRAYAV